MLLSQDDMSNAMAVYVGLEKLQALGEVVNLISMYNPNSFDQIGCCLGFMIMDYAKLVDRTLHLSNMALEDFFLEDEDGAPATVAPRQGL
jgi:hypothetical protein